MSHVNMYLTYTSSDSNRLADQMSRACDPMVDVRNKMGRRAIRTRIIAVRRMGRESVQGTP